MTTINARNIVCNLGQIEKLIAEIKKIRPDLDDDEIINLIKRMTKESVMSKVRA